MNILLTVHCIADYPLQGDFLAQNKGKYSFLMFIHSFIWAGLIYFFIGLLAVPIVPNWVFTYLLAGHYIIDTIKCALPDSPKKLTTYLYADQLLHVIQIIVVLWMI